MVITHTIPKKRRRPPDGCNKPDITQEIVFEVSLLFFFFFFFRVKSNPRIWDTKDVDALLTHTHTHSHWPTRRYTRVWTDASVRGAKLLYTWPSWSIAAAYLFPVWVWEGSGRQVGFKYRRAKQKKYASMRVLYLQKGFILHAFHFSVIQSVTRLFKVEWGMICFTKIQKLQVFFFSSSPFEKSKSHYFLHWWCILLHQQWK